MLVLWLQTEIHKRRLSPYFIVDGLDRCTTETRRTTLAYPNRLCHYASFTKVLVSTRAEIGVWDDLDGFKKLRFEPDEKIDELIVKKHLSVRLPSLSGELLALCTESLASRAKGNARRWISEAIRDLKSSGLTEDNHVEAFVTGTSLPSNLQDFYRSRHSEYLQKGNGAMDELVVSTALTFLAVSHWPMTIIELVHLSRVHVYENTRHMHRIAPPANLDQCASLLTQISPFISSIQFDEPQKRQVKLCDESVRQFVLREWARGGPIQQLQGVCRVTRDGQQRINQRATEFRATLRFVAKIHGYADLDVWR